jgi:hypothetical protein
MTEVSPESEWEGKTWDIIGKKGTKAKLGLFLCVFLFAYWNGNRGKILTM